MSERSSAVHETAVEGYTEGTKGFAFTQRHCQGLTRESGPDLACGSLKTKKMAIISSFNIKQQDTFKHSSDAHCRQGEDQIAGRLRCVLPSLSHGF